jgi:magnesium-transporting ATPase (P-type)
MTLKASEGFLSFVQIIPFATVHLLFINLLTDSLPAIAVGLEPHNKDIMKEKPRGINTPLLNKSFSLRVLSEGLIIAIATLISFHIGLSTGDQMVASTMAFSTLCLARLFHGFNARSNQSLFKIGFSQTSTFGLLSFSVWSCCTSYYCYQHFREYLKLPHSTQHNSVQFTRCH